MTRFLIALLIGVTTTSAGRAQTVPRVTAGWGVDTTAGAWHDHLWQRDAAAIFRLWADYLRSDAATYRPTAAWSAAEQQQWRMYDLTTGIAYKGFPATVLDIRPSEPGNTDEFVIRTLFASATGDAHDVRPVALTTVYAVRENGRWVLSNALPRRTRDWQRATVGRITYITEGRAVDHARATRTAFFADSLAAAFGLPPLDELTYYVAQSPESMHRAMGVEWAIGGQGSYAVTGNNMVLTGNAAFGEEHLHEITHLLFARIIEGRTHNIVSEGIATYHGGSMGSTYRQLTAEYGAYLKANPHITLDAVLESDGGDKGWHPTGATLVDLVHRKGGIPAVQQLLRSGRSNEELRSAVAQLLGTTWGEVGTMWRAHLTRQ